MKLSRIFLLCAFLISNTLTPNNSFLIIGHRGACGYKPENTLSSFRTALDMNVHMIELDVYACKTGELVVIHDDEVDRTTNGHGNVVDMTFDELRNLIVEGVEQIPTLEEVIELLDGCVTLNIELKGPHTAKPVAELLNQYLKNGWESSDFVVSSFDHEQIKTFQKLSPEILTGALFSSRHDPELIIDQALAAHANFIGIDTLLVNKTLVNKACQNNLPIYVFTINNRLRADELKLLGISGIFSNYPDLMM